MDQALLESMEANESMFVQQAHAASVRDGRLTLDRMTPATLYFSDRPHREVGHISNKDFVSIWDQGENSFESDPPNAVLAFLESGDGEPEDAVVVISDPQLGDGSMSYAIELLEGNLPPSTGACTLFIDPLGRPLSPGSAAGVRRRQRRRH